MVSKAVLTTVSAVANAKSWDARVAEIRKIPANHGNAEHQDVYARIARQVYVPALAPDFAYIHPMEFYEPEHFERSYQAAHAGTRGFTLTEPGVLASTIQENPEALLALRNVTGLLRNELAQSTKLADPAGRGVSASVIDNYEKGGVTPKAAVCDLLGRTLDAIMQGTLFPKAPDGSNARLKQEKPDTADGWATAARLAEDGVPYSMFLHQRHYGGAFRQLLDATSEHRGDIIEDAVEELFASNRVPFIRTGSHNQAQVERRFGLAVHPAPDFVVYDGSGGLRAMLECKGANDGGTARDKAARFQNLRVEGQRLGGVPVFAVLGGLGWLRVNDTLGPVVSACDGRVFTLSTLADMLTVRPISELLGASGLPDGELD